MSITPGQHRAMINDLVFDGEGDKFHVKIQFNVIDLKGMSATDFDAAILANDLSSVDKAGIDTQSDATQITWFGSFKGGARPITIETLARLGATDVNKLLEGKSGVDAMRVYGLTIKNEEYDGKTRTKVSSVWIPGQGGFGSKLDKGTVQAQLLKLGLSGELAKAAQAVTAKVEAGF